MIASANLTDHGIVSVVDVDGDGHNEILLDWNNYWQQHRESARLVRFDGSTLTEVASFGQVLLDNCGLGGDLTYTVIHATVQKGSSPKFTRVEKTGTCR